ncbi:MAG: 30S ribosomal protein S9 [Patescibacteria group bacterium]|nr:30S ribosomal protein S9 [Patescibacteria group bacterium]MDE1966169.1 30S ribosomal protein S9 [Patescibacteria group bacterium]
MATKDTIQAVGRRKTAIASVRLVEADSASVTVNGVSAADYFHTDERTKVATEALTGTETAKTYAVRAQVSGGGIAAQAAAVRHAIARALIKAEPNTRKAVKAEGLLTRDPRAKERKKPGLVKARKRKQWSKR